MFKQREVLREEQTDISGADGADVVTPGAADKQYAYPEGFDAEYHGNPTILKYANEDGTFNQANIMKSLIHATSNIGKDKITKPNEHFTEDQWKETFRALGVPESVDEYKIENTQAVEGIEADEALFAKFKETAHAAGILPSQAQKIIDMFNTSVGETIESQRTASEASKLAAENELKTKWGTDYERNTKLAEISLSKFAEGEELEKVKGILDTPAVKELFVKIGNSLLDDKFQDDVKGNLGSSMEQLTNERTAIQMNPNFKKGHPLYAGLHKRFMEINEALAPGLMGE